MKRTKHEDCTCGRVLIPCPACDEPSCPECDDWFGKCDEGFRMLRRPPRDRMHRGRKDR